MGKNSVRKDFFTNTTWVCPAGVTKVRVVVTAYLHSQIAGGAVIANNTCQLWVWGGNTQGQLGTAEATVTTAARSSPVLVAGVSAWHQVCGLLIAGASAHGISVSGDLYSWGLNTFGQGGDGTVSNRSSPTLCNGGLKYRQVDGGVSQTIARTNSNSAVTMGQNTNGQLGVGDVTNRSNPTTVLGGKTWRYVACSGEGAHMMGINDTGDLYGWGLNANGQLGLGDVIPRSSPVLVLGGKKWAQVSCGSFSTVALTQDGDVYAWGVNVNGELGVGDVIPRSSPVVVLGGKKWLQISATGSHSVAGLDTVGRIYTWGLNANGQLGVSDVLPRSSPTLITSGDRYCQVFAGYTSMYAIDFGCQLFSWGSNASGELGVGDTVPRSVPTIVAGSIRAQGPQTSIVADSVIPVQPGSSYTVIFDTGAGFAYQPLWQDPYGNGTIPAKITLEYEA